MSGLRFARLLPITTNASHTACRRAVLTTSFNTSVDGFQSKLCQLRYNSTKDTKNESTSLLDRNPEDVARKILSRFPGYTVHNKTCSVLVLLSSLAFLISNEYIIIEAMTGEIYSFILASFIWYKMVGETVRNFIKTKRKNVSDFVNSFKERHKLYFNDRVIESKRVSELPEITAALHEMSREMVRMKAKIYKLKQINEVNEVVKAWLDANVAYEFTLRNSVQQWIADRVSKAMMAALMQPQTKNEILKDAILTLEEFSKSQR